MSYGPESLLRTVFSDRKDSHTERCQAVGTPGSYGHGKRVADKVAVVLQGASSQSAEASELADEVDCGHVSTEPRLRNELVDHEVEIC